MCNLRAIFCPAEKTPENIPIYIARECVSISRNFSARVTALLTRNFSDAINTVILHFFFSIFFFHFSHEEEKKNLELHFSKTSEFNWLISRIAMLEHSNKFPSHTHIHADGVYTPPRKKRKNAGTILGTLRARPTRPTLYAFPNNTCAARLCAYTRGQERKAAAAAITGAQSATERNENPPPRVYMYTHTLTLCSSLSRSFLLSFLGVSFDTRALHTRLRITEHITDHHYLHNSPSARAERERLPSAWRSPSADLSRARASRGEYCFSPPSERSSERFVPAIRIPQWHLNILCIDIFCRARDVDNALRLLYSCRDDALFEGDIVSPLN